MFIYILTNKLKSALQDSRFDPISEEEFPKLTCAVSLLHDFEEVDDIMDWEVNIYKYTSFYYHI